MSRLTFTVCIPLAERSQMWSGATNPPFVHYSFTLTYSSVQNLKEAPMVIMQWDIARGSDGRNKLVAQWTAPVIPEPRESQEAFGLSELIGA